jgi:hypothetical protein
MDLEPDLHEERWRRAVAAAEIVSLALERNLPHMALAAAREAARSALLALGKEMRRLAGPDLALLRDLAAAPPQHLAGRPAERQAVVRAALSILDRLFPRPPSAAKREPARGTGAGHPSRRDPDRRHPNLRAARGSVVVAPSKPTAPVVGGHPA